MRAVKLLLLIFFTSFLYITESYSQWFWQNPLPHGYTLRSVSFTDVNNGTAVGEAGTILRTTNGGTSWINQSSGTTNTLFGVSFTDANNGTAVGEAGIILRTTDGGTSWISQTSGTTNWLWGVSFTDANNGTVVGEFIILRTTNGGLSWINQVSGAGWLFGVSFSDANNGTVVGSHGRILRTTNGGVNWISQTSGTANSLRGVSFTDANNGTAVGDGGTILRTTNGGVTFIEVRKEIASSFLLMQNHPNPFNPSTTINYQIPAFNFVTLKVYDVLGNEVATLVNEEKSAGEYEVEFNSSWTGRGLSLPSGVYFYQLRVNSFVESRKMILMK